MGLALVHTDEVEAYSRHRVPKPGPFEMRSWVPDPCCASCLAVVFARMFKPWRILASLLFQLLENRGFPLGVYLLLETLTTESNLCEGFQASTWCCVEPGGSRVMAPSLCKRLYCPSLALQQNETGCFSRDSWEPLKVCPMHFSIQRCLSPPIRVLSGYSGHIKKSYHSYSVSLYSLSGFRQMRIQTTLSTHWAQYHPNARGCLEPRVW